MARKFIRNPLNYDVWTPPNVDWPEISLRDGLSRPDADEYVLTNTPGVVFENLLIMGTRVSEGPTALPGDIRA